MTKMSALVVDESDKASAIQAVIEQLPQAVTISQARSFQSGLAAITRQRYDLIILDMTMPSFDIGPNEPGGMPQAYGGVDLMRHMKRRKITTPVIVVTQFDRFGAGKERSTIEELGLQLRREFEVQYRGLIQYSVTYDGWKRQLLRTIANLMETPGDSA